INLSRGAIEKAHPSSGPSEPGVRTSPVTQTTRQDRIDDPRSLRTGSAMDSSQRTARCSVLGIRIHLGAQDLLHPPTVDGEYRAQPLRADLRGLERAVQDGGSGDF